MFLFSSLYFKTNETSINFRLGSKAGFPNLGVAGDPSESTNLNLKNFHKFQNFSKIFFPGRSDWLIYANSKKHLWGGVYAVPHPFDPPDGWGKKNKKLKHLGPFPISPNIYLQTWT